jgi:hypothetical protein
MKSSLSEMVCIESTNKQMLIALSCLSRHTYVIRILFWNENALHGYIYIYIYIYIRRWYKVFYNMLPN